MSQDARFDEEQSTARRAQVLNMTYVNTYLVHDKVLYKQYLTVPEMKQYKLVPLTADEHHLQFGITTTTSQKTMQMLVQKFLDQQVTFSIISEAGFREYIYLYDPPKKIEYYKSCRR